VIPRVFREFSGSRTMVMEWVDCISAANDRLALQKAGLDPKEVMQLATEVFGYQIFSTGHVHCDPHPGNLLVRKAPTDSSLKWQLVLLDHGLYCDLPDRLRRDYADFWVATALGDTDSAIRICKSWGIADQEATEFFASMTQFRRVRLGSGSVGTAAGLFRGQSSQSNPPTVAEQRIPRRKLTPAEATEMQQRLKSLLAKFLQTRRLSHRSSSLLAGI